MSMKRCTTSNFDYDVLNKNTQVITYRTIQSKVLDIDDMGEIQQLTFMIHVLNKLVNYMVSIQKKEQYSFFLKTMFISFLRLTE